MTGVMVMLAKRIKQLRSEKGWSQADLANLMNWREKSVVNWENGSSSPSAKNILRLAEVFCITIDCLYGRTIQNPIYIDYLPEKEQRRIRWLVQAYANMIESELNEQDNTSNDQS